MGKNQMIASKFRSLRSKLIPKASEKLGRALKQLPLEISGGLPVLALENSRTDLDSLSEISFATSLSAGFDLKAAEEVVIPAGEWRLVDSGLRLAPQSTQPIARIRFGKTGFDVVAELQIRPRSGLAVKRGITVLNSPGTVDADYEGKIMTCLMNHGREAFKVSKGDKISQGVFALAIRPHSVPVAEKNRGAGGFGSTGR
jgi:dUTP pyrophosphatase